MGLPLPAFAAEDGAALARDAYLFVLPLIEMAAARQRTLNPSAGGVGAKINGFVHARALVTPAGRAITTPNNDTLYSSAWLDLTKGPVTLTIPPTGDRYYSVAVMDMFTNNNAILGSRTVGGAGAKFTLVGPGQAGGGPGVVRVATPHAWVLVRTLVDGEADMAAAHKVQDGFVLVGPTAGPPPAYATREAPAAEVFASAKALLLSDPATASDSRMLRRLDAVLGKGGVTPDAVAAGVAQARAIIQFAKGRQAFVGGWSYPRPNLGDYGQDYIYRAIVAIAGLGALTPPEAMYMKAQGEDGNGLFNGDGPYRLTLPGKVPVEAFWSLTMYEATADGQFFLTENPINRYAIGDRTPGLKFGADGALDLWISRTDPGGERSANWLPAPKSGPFSLTLRAYLPKPELLDGRWRVPAVVKV